MELRFLFGEKYLKQPLGVKKPYLDWGFWEWTLLQGVAVIFYVLILARLIYTVYLGQNQISDLVLIMGYVTTTQVFLNNISAIKDTLTDTKVALTRLAKNRTFSAVNLSDLT